MKSREEGNEYAEQMLNVVRYHHNEGMRFIEEIRGGLKYCSYTTCVKNAAAVMFHLGEISHIYDDLSEFIKGIERGNYLNSKRGIKNTLLEEYSRVPLNVLNENEIERYKRIQEDIYDLFSELSLELTRIENEFEDSFNQCTCRKKSSGSDSKYKEDIIDAERDRSGIRERAETQRRKLSKDGKGKYIEGS